MRRSLVLMSVLFLWTIFLAGNADVMGETAEPQESTQEKESQDAALRQADALAKALPNLTVATDGGGSFSRENTSYFRFVQEPHGILGRLELVPEQHGGASEAETVSIPLHEQKKEVVRLAPGIYTLHAFFWPRGEAFPVRYPRAATLELQKGQTATFSLDQNSYSAIQGWLHAIAESKKQNANAETAGKTQPQRAKSPELEILLPSQEE